MTTTDAISACIAICLKHKLGDDWNGSMAIQEMRRLAANGYAHKIKPMHRKDGDCG